MRYLLLGFFIVFFQSQVFAEWKVEQVLHSNGKVEVLHVEKTSNTITENKRVVRSIPMILSEESGSTLDQKFEVVLYSDRALPKNARELYSNLEIKEVYWEGSEVRTLVDQGPSSNRINLTIVGDGYTSFEKEQFFQDAQRMTDDMFTGATFASYLPLFNVYAVFVPSKDSGVSDTVKRNTALGLYRSPAHSKRAIMPGNTSAIERALSLAPARADYPILIANDDYYGGLGGRYAITTRSEGSGTMVLRHELGHNFGSVGEEYDGGQVYQGANYSSSKNVPWSHWINGASEVFDLQFLSGAYVWESLRKAPVSISFNLPQSAATSRVFVQLSTVGWSDAGDVTVLLDGVEQPYEGHFTKDRSFFEFYPSQSLAPGKHVLQIRENKKDSEDRVLAFAQVYAFPEGYDFETKDRVAAFQSFYSPGRSSGYRPTHQSCLMRDMRLKHFCNVDLENMWHRFLAKVELIDDLTISQDRVDLKAVSLKGVEIKWYKKLSNGAREELEAFRNQESLNRSQSLLGQFEVDVSFKTPEVRKYNSRFQASKRFELK